MQTPNLDAFTADSRANAGTPQVDPSPFSLPFGVIACASLSLSDPTQLDLRLRYTDGPLTSPLLFDRAGATALLDRLLAFLAPVQAGGMAPPTTHAWFDVVQERRRQIHVEGFDAVWDDRANSMGELAAAAACYAMAGMLLPEERAEHGVLDVPKAWAYDNDWWKPTTPRGDLVKAAALILAEIDRQDRAAAQDAAA